MNKIKEEVLNDEKTSAKTTETEKIEQLDEEKQSIMSSFLDKTKALPIGGDIVEGKVISLEKNAVYVNLPPFGVGIIFGKEYIAVRDVFKNMNPGDSIVAKVTSEENEDGYIELSLKEARQAVIWGEAEELMEKKSVMDLPIKEANKGGLIIEWQGIQGFLPASQLKAEHYPRVIDGNKDRILEELNKIVGQSLPVAIIGVLPKENKLIFSEKDPNQKEKGQIVEKYNIGDIIEGEITSAVDFGIFVKIEDELEGLIHISEISWSLVKDPKTLFKPGDKIQVKIIEIENGKISLSIKALTENPWKRASGKYKKGDEVSGVIIKFNKHGALASIEEGVAGLVHVSEFENEEKLRETLEIGKSYSFKINIFEPDSQKMTLSFIS
ncbi:MAG: S1 RNA-binding domain-containing protein [Patescibacteria group bacterium]|nr:S1 RNA-binding domain-containing protein [Patescibacteria group bacterium]